jgi:7-carboxy-7-deazaguanine synthase
MPERRFPVVELFGPTIQGEGPDVGQPCYFVRFGGCDFRCGWSDHAAANAGQDPDGTFVCDSLHAVLPHEVRNRSTMMDAAEIVAELERLADAWGPRYVVFSGGNPALLKLDTLVDQLHLFGWRIAVETQGTRWQDWLLDADRIVVSPKPPSSRQPFRMSDLQRFLEPLSKLRVALKVPIYDDADLAFAERVFAALPLHGRYLSIANDWRKPNTTEELLARYRWVIEQAQTRPHTASARVLGQIHVLLWGNERER